jgi:hypothetical protein
MAWSSVLGVAALIVLLSIIVFTFSRGEKVRKKPEGTPADPGYYPPPDGSSGPTS